MYPPRSAPETYFQWGYEVGWGIDVVMILGGYIVLSYFYKKAIRPIVVNKDAEQDRPTIDDDDRKATKISEFYLKKRLQRYLGIKKDKKKSAEVAKKLKSKKNEKEKEKEKGKDKGKDHKKGRH